MTPELRARWQQLRNHIADLEDEGLFDMGSWLERLRIRSDDIVIDCGTAGCLAGHAVILAHGHDRNFETRFFDDEPVDELAAEWLGLDGAQANYAFLGDWSDTGIINITRDEALQYLDLVIKTGDPYSSLREPEGNLDAESELSEVANHLVDCLENLSPAARAVLDAAWMTTEGSRLLAGSYPTLDEAIHQITGFRDRLDAGVYAPIFEHRELEDA